MKRFQLTFVSLLLSVVSTNGLSQTAAPSAPAKNPAPSITKLDPALDVNKAAADNVTWHDVTQWGLEGRILPDQERTSWFDRLPASANGKVTSNVWSLSRDSAE